MQVGLALRQLLVHGCSHFDRRGRAARGNLELLSQLLQRHPGLYGYPELYLLGVHEQALLTCRPEIGLYRICGLVDGLVLGALFPLAAIIQVHLEGVEVAPPH